MATEPFQVEGDIEGELELVGGNRFIRVDERLIQLWEQPTDNTVMFASRDDKWYRWKPSLEDDAKLQAQRRETQLAEEFAMTQRNLASMVSNATSSADSEARSSSSAGDDAGSWNEQRAFEWFKGVCPAAINLSSIDNAERTALHHASAKGPSELVDFLIEHLDVADAKDRVGKTALHYACESGRVSNVRALLRFWSQQEGGYKWFDARDKNRTTPLMLAAKNGHAAIISALLIPVGFKHIDLLLKDMDGKNALHWASEGGHLDCVEAILDADTENQLVAEKDARGRLPIDLASNATAKKRLALQATKNDDQLTSMSTTSYLAIAAFVFIILGLALGIYASSQME